MTTKIDICETLPENVERRYVTVTVDNLADRSEDENDIDLRSLDWLLVYRLPQYFTLSDEESVRHFADTNNYHGNNCAQISSDEDICCENANQPMVQKGGCDARIGKRGMTTKCTLLCWVYRVLATAPERHLSLNDIYRRFIILNPDWGRLSPDWKASVGQTLLSSKCFIYKHSLWSVNPEYALRHERAALAQGPSHRCPPSASSAKCERSIGDVLANFRHRESEKRNCEGRIAML